jgi:hypothetical protein
MASHTACAHQPTLELQRPPPTQLQTAATPEAAVTATTPAPAAAEVTHFPHPFAVVRTLFHTAKAVPNLLHALAEVHMDATVVYEHIVLRAPARDALFQCMCPNPYAPKEAPSPWTQCQDELQMQYVMVYFTELKLNAHLVEEALQTRLQDYPWVSDCGGRWPWAKRRRTSLQKRAWHTRSSAVS